MTTGKKHGRYHDVNTDREGYAECRCTIGEDHDEEGGLLSEYLSEDDAKDIWLSSGKDEDYDFRS